MKNQRQNRNSDVRAGFTLLEIVVTIVVFSVLTAAAMVSWASFTRYQELRGDANAFHKELLALKAKAVADSLTFRVVYDADNMGYKVTVEGVKEDGTPYPNNPRPVIKEVRFAKNVAFGDKTGDWNSDGYGTGTSGTNKRIKIIPDNLNAFEEGSVVIKNSSKKQFRVFKDANSIKPELYYRNGSGGSWTKI